MISVFKRCAALWDGKLTPSCATSPSAQDDAQTQTSKPVNLAQPFIGIPSTVHVDTSLCSFVHAYSSHLPFSRVELHSSEPISCIVNSQLRGCLDYCCCIAGDSLGGSAVSGPCAGQLSVHLLPCPLLLSPSCSAGQTLLCSQCLKTGDFVQHNSASDES